MYQRGKTNEEFSKATGERMTNTVTNSLLDFTFQISIRLMFIPLEI